MLYMGNKNRIAKQLLPPMLAARKDRPWVEPFVGSGGVIDKVGGERIGNDKHQPLIALLRAVQDGWIPPTEISRESYYEIKNNPNAYSEELVGFVGFVCSFGGKWWGGYAANKEGRNYAETGSRTLVKQAKNLKGIIFVCGSYLEMDMPPNSLIYCDPPYEGMTAYGGGFDHEVFWQWCRDKGKEGHVVFVSEYSAPDDFRCVKEVHHKTTMNKNTSQPRTERLFRCS